MSTPNAKPSAFRSLSVLVWVGLPWLFVAAQIKQPNVSAGVVLGATLIGLAQIYLGIAVHELGHIFVAWRVGYKVTHVEIGEGPLLAKTYCRRVEICLRLLPNSGLVRIQPPEFSGRTLKLLLFCAAGCALQLIYALGLWCLVRASAPESFSGAILRNYLLWHLALFHIGLFVGNLYPARQWIVGQFMPNDGMQMLDLLRGRTLRRRVDSWRRIAESNTPDEPGSLTFRKLFEQESLDWNQRLQTMLLLEHAQAHALAYHAGEHLLASTPKDHVHYLFLLDSVASKALFRRWPEPMGRSLVAAKAHLDSHPALVSLAGTVGGLLLELNDPDAAEPYLRQAALSDAMHDRGICFAYLGLLEQTRGRKTEALKHAKTAREHQHAHPIIPDLLSRIETTEC